MLSIYRKDMEQSFLISTLAEIMPSEIGGIRVLENAVDSDCMSIFQLMKQDFLIDLFNNNYSNQRNYLQYCAQICFHFLAHIKGPEFVLQDEFDAIRKWIVYGHDNPFAVINDYIPDTHRDDHQIIIFKSENHLYGFLHFFGKNDSVCIRLNKQFTVEFETIGLYINPNKEEIIGSLSETEMRDLKSMILRFKDNSEEKYSLDQIHNFICLAEKGDANMMTLLGRIYKKGLGVEVNLEKTILWYKKGVELRNPDCIQRLIRLCLDEEFLKCDKEKITELYYRLEESGDKTGFGLLATVYYEGKYLPQNYEKSLNYLISDFEKNNQHNHANKIAVRYELGLGTKINLIKAKEWRERMLNNKLFIKDSDNFDGKLQVFCLKNHLEFHNLNLLGDALTHSSYAYERNCESNERLEFLGDAILESAVRTILYHNDDHLSEGVMTKLKADFVDASATYALAVQMGIPDFIRLGNGITNTANTSILGDAFEAVIGAIYLDSGYEYTTNYIFSLLGHISKTESTNKNYKGMLQDRFSQCCIEYFAVDEGPDHDKSFFVTVSIDNKQVGKGRGKTKKAAEQNAAKDALK